MNPAEIVEREVQCKRVLQWSFVNLRLGSLFVRRVKRRIDIRIVRFCRSTCDVQIFFGSGCPITGTTSVLATTSAGEYRRSPSGVAR